MDHYASHIYLILLAIEVVLLFTYTSSDNFTLLFYILLSFVRWTVYKNDTPEHIISFQKGWYDKTVWISTVSATYINGTLISSVGKKGENRSDWALHNQRPVLFLIDYN